MIDGFTALAPDLALASASGFAIEEFRFLASLEERNFWFRGRNKVIISAIEGHCRGARSFLEIGCGTGFVLQGVGRALPHLELFGSEIAVAGLGFAKGRNPMTTLFQMDAMDIPFEDEFDVIGAFDVLEHIDDDELVISEMWRAIRPGGAAIITVPQHMLLWSSHDENAGHFRRYGVTELQRKLERAGFCVESKTSFVSLLLPVLAMGRRGTVARDKKAVPVELRLPRLLNRAFEMTLDIEHALIARGIHLPAGGSQLVIARKPI
jgi:SAM-dependent methyltransferase